MRHARLLLVLLGLTAACYSLGDSFGRFGYKPLNDLPGFTVNNAGIVVTGGTSLQFAHPSKGFLAIETSATAQSVALDGGPGMPSAVRFSLVGNCLDLRFDEGASLSLNGRDAPFLSWKDGSSGPDVPTPQVQWLLVSYPTPQVPVVLGFSGDRYSFKVTGAAGHWKLDCPGFSGWLRMMLPLGDREVATPDTASLGTLADAMARDDSHWSVPTPKIRKLSVQSDDLGLDAEWTFDGPGAVIPPSITLAQLGGYPISVRSTYHELPGSPGLGPIDLVDGLSLTVHFPCRRIRPGRALGLGPATESSIGSASPLDIPSVVDLALESLMAHRDAALAKLADDTSSRYLEDAAYAVEPLTGQQMPLQSDGTGADLAAAHALLMQSTSDAVNSTDPNSLLDSLGFVRDWWSWKIWASNPTVSRRASALTALAGAMSQSDVTRLLGATLEAGLEADDGWRIWKGRFAVQPSEPKPIQPLRELREAFFALKGGPEGNPFFALLQSPIRIGIGSGLELARAGSQLELSWTTEDVKPSVITFFNSEPIALKAGPNLKRITVEQGKGLISMYYGPTVPGLCQVFISVPASTPPIPAQANPPDYKE